MRLRLRLKQGKSFQPLKFSFNFSMSFSWWLCVFVVLFCSIANSTDIVNSPTTYLQLRGSTATLTSVEDILDKLAHRDKETQDLELEFYQEIEFSVFKETRTMEGKVVFKQPNKIFYQLLSFSGEKESNQRKSHTFSVEKESNQRKSPTIQQTVVSDGKQIWIYNHQTNQVFVDLWKNWEGVSYFVPGVFNPKGKITDLKKVYNFALEAEENDCYLLLLVPKQKVKSVFNIQEEEFKFYLWISKGNFAPRRTKFVTETVICTTLIKAYRTNLNPQDELFKFKIPPDAEVLRLFK